MELGLILGRNLEKPGKRQNLGVFQGFSRSNFAFLPFSRFFQVFQVFQVTWQPCSYSIVNVSLAYLFVSITMPLIINTDDHILQPHERYGYCTDVDLFSEEGHAILTILFTTKGLTRYLLTFRFDVAHLESWTTFFGASLGECNWKGDTTDTSRCVTGDIFRHRLHCGMHPEWDIW